MRSKPSAAETVILQVLWQHQPCTVRQVHQIVSADKDVGYTTTLKQMQRLFDKGLVEREDGPGKSFLYRAVHQEEDTKQQLFDGFLKTTFSDSVSDLVMHALGKGNPSEDELREIRDFLQLLDADEQQNDRGGVR